MSAHAVFSPSAADRWISCPASHLRALALPPAPSSSYADRGTLLHTYAALGIVHNLKRVDAEAKANGLVLEDDERAAIGTYVAFCKRLRRGNGLWGVEARVSYSEELFGTVDFWSVIGQTLHVVDFKGGRGIRVDALDNPQLMTYAAMLLGGLDPRISGPIGKVELHIVQPLFEGAPPTNSCAYSIPQIDAWRAGLVKAMAAAKAPDAPFHPGEHCRFCPVKPRCPALTGLAAALPAPPAQALLPVDKLSEWLGKADIIEGWIEALRAHAHTLIAEGAAIPGWKLVDKRAMRKWGDEEAMLHMASLHKISAKETVALSPAKLEKKYKVIPLALQPFIVQESSGKNLVRDPVTARVPDAPQPDLNQALLNLQYRV